MKRLFPLLTATAVSLTMTAMTAQAGQSKAPPPFDAFEHGWIPLALYQGNVEELYKSDDLGGVFLFVIALHKTFGERAPALYDETAQLELAAAFAKFGMSGHNIENVLDAFLRNPDDFIKGGVKTVITQKIAESEAANIIEDLGAESSYAKQIEAGISKFAAGAMAAVEEKYRPATDGARPPNVSDEQFEKDPTLGKQQIERFNDVYKYYDAEIIKEHAGGDPHASGYTLSRTPPNAEVETIEEWYSVFKRDVLDDGEIISRGRTVPRAKVFPVPAMRGDYLDLHGNRIFGDPFYYSPPSTASTMEHRPNGGSEETIVAKRDMSVASPEPSGTKSSLAGGNGNIEPSDDGSKPPLLQLDEKGDAMHDPEFGCWSSFKAGTVITLITTNSVTTKDGQTTTDKYSVRDRYRIESAKPEWIEISCDEATLNEGKQYQPSKKFSMGVGLNKFMGNSLYVSRRHSPWMSCITGQPFRTNSLAVLKTGIQTLNVAGQRLECRWFTTEKKAGEKDSHNATVWICDQIPGRFVRALLRDDDNITSEIVIESIKTAIVDE